MIIFALRLLKEIEISAFATSSVKIPEIRAGLACTYAVEENV